MKRRPGYLNTEGKAAALSERAKATMAARIETCRVDMVSIVPQKRYAVALESNEDMSVLSVSYTWFFLNLENVSPSL